MKSTPKAAKGSDEIVVFAVSHPIRVDALRILNEREASVAEVARELREDAKKVGNHVKALLEHGCIEWTRTQRNRGAEEHFYRGSGRTGLSAEEWERLRPNDRLQISTHIFLAAVAEGLAALRTGKVDTRLDRHLSYQTAEVDEQAWAEMTALLEETAHRAAQIKDAADRRVSEAGTGISIMIALIGAERATSAGNAAISRFALPSSEE